MEKEKQKNALVELEPRHGTVKRRNNASVVVFNPHAPLGVARKKQPRVSPNDMWPPRRTTPLESFFFFFPACPDLRDWVSSLVVWQGSPLVLDLSRGLSNWHSEAGTEEKFKPKTLTIDCNRIYRLSDK